MKNVIGAGGRCGCGGFWATAAVERRDAASSPVRTQDTIRISLSPMRVAGTVEVMREDRSR
jgi:hypothetical protein